MREIWFALAVALALGGAFPAAAAPPSANRAKAARLLAVTPQDRILGKPDAPITIIEYGSLSCPHCAHFAYEVLPKLKPKWIDRGKARLVFRDYPLDREAQRAEMVARCAPPARYYPLIDMLFANQDKWVIAKDWKGALQHLVELAGISKKRFDACLADKAVENQVTQSRLSATQLLAVDATPTFFINGKKFEGEPTVDGFEHVLSSTKRGKSK